MKARLSRLSKRLSLSGARDLVRERDVYPVPMRCVRRHEFIERLKYQLRAFSGLSARFMTIDQLDLSRH